MIGLKFEDPQETNAVNSSVIEMLEKTQIGLFPSVNKLEKSSHDSFNLNDAEVKLSDEMEE